MKIAVNWFEIYTSDFKRAKKFYSEVFGCELTDLPMAGDRHSNMEYALFPGNESNPGTAGALVRIDEARPGVGGTLIYFATKEINEELNRVEANGGKIIREKIKAGDFGFIALIQDTEGNMIGLHSMK